jgi:hypothetical protein
MVHSAFQQNGRRKRKTGGSLLSRCRALQGGAPDVVFSHEEVREILTLVLEQVRWSAEEEINDESDDREAENGNDRPIEEFAIEERPWKAGEIAEQIQILSAAAGVDWREELALAIQSLQEERDEHAKQIDEARRHVLRNLVLDERSVNRLALYEPQINSQFKSTYALLERARAYRLGCLFHLRSASMSLYPRRTMQTVFNQRLLAGLRARTSEEEDRDDTFQDPDEDQPARRRNG